MKITTQAILTVADAYLSASDAKQETTVSHRVFRDSKKITALRAGCDITVGRFNDAMTWFAEHWPDGADIPTELRPYLSGAAASCPEDKDAA